MKNRNVRPTTESHSGLPIRTCDLGQFEGADSIFAMRRGPTRV